MYQLLQGQVQVYCPKRRGLREVRFLPRSNACGSTPSASLSWDRAGSRTPGPLAIPLRAFLLPFACLVALFSPWHMTDRAHPPSQMPPSSQAVSTLNTSSSATSSPQDGPFQDGSARRETQ